MSEIKNSDWSDLSPSERPYNRVVLPNPAETPFEDWSVNERRAYILDLIIDEHMLPSDVPRVETGKKFGVSHAQIHQDIEIVKEFMSNHLDEDFEAEAYSLFKSAVKNLKDEDPYKAIQVFEKWSGWLENRGEVEDESKSELTFEGTEDMSISFETVPADDFNDDEDE